MTLDQFKEEVITFFELDTLDRWLVEVKGSVYWVSDGDEYFCSWSKDRGNSGAWQVKRLDCCNWEISDGCGSTLLEATNAVNHSS